ncbi:MAG: ribonuclease HII [Myxococcaceae bacterium]|nr:ribonuclease HII [Myxococcaceae bacterium]
MRSLKELLGLSVPELRERFLERRRPVPEGLLEALEADPRSGARELARRIRDLRRKNRAEGQRLRNLLRFETELYAQGFTFIAGCDEAGMAPLAGPVVAGAVILPKGYRVRGLDDSKKILDPGRREELAAIIKRDAICWATGMASVEEIDTLNIYHAGLLAMRRAVLGLSRAPEYVLVDARRIPEYETPQRGIIHGDALSMSIAAASIIAKTTRDALMDEMDRKYPGYGFASHKGYPTPEHCRVLKEKGAVEIHRRSFARVRQALGLEPLQLDAFPETLPEDTDEAAAAESEA